MNTYQPTDEDRAAVKAMAEHRDDAMRPDRCPPDGCPACGRLPGKGCGRDDQPGTRIGCWLLGAPLQPISKPPQTTMMAVAYALQTAAEDEFDAWLAQQSDEVRTLAEADQVELWAEDANGKG